MGCHIRDLERLSSGDSSGWIDHRARPTASDPTAQIRLALTSDDLLALVRGELHFAAAWASGRISIKAGIGDLFKLRKLM